MSRESDTHHPSPLLLAYVDESYTADRFYLGAVVVDGAAAERVEVGLDSIMRDYGGRFGLAASTEMHGNPLFQGKEAWREVPTRVRINVYERAMEVIGDSGAEVVLRGMNVRRQRERYVDPHAPHEVVLGTCWSASTTTPGLPGRTPSSSLTRCTRTSVIARTSGPSAPEGPRGTAARGSGS